MKHLLFFAAIVIAATSQSYGQYEWEAGISGGLMNAAADVGTKKGTNLSPFFYDWQTTQLNSGIYAGGTYKGIVGARVEFTRGAVAGSDANSNSKHIQSRNLTFKSHIYEASLVTTFYPTSLIKLKREWKVKPYVMAGVGMFSFYPKGYCVGEWVRLRPLHTEGQNSKQYPDRKEYSLTALSVPLGVGGKYEICPKFVMRMELLYRYTSTDYLDDVSTTYVDPAIVKGCVQKSLADHAEMFANMYKQINSTQDRTGKPRGNEYNNDRFFTINIKFGYVFGKRL